MLTISELKILISALGDLDVEYGERPERSALLAKLREARDRLIAEAERYH